jgi:quinol monooxygenase YgiN
MITEIAQIDVKPGMEAEFETGVKNAAPIFKRAKSCHGLALERSIEKPGRYRLFVKWATVENHTVDFSRFGRLPGMAQARRPLLRRAARSRARATGRARLLSQDESAKTNQHIGGDHENIRPRRRGDAGARLACDRGVRPVADQRHRF